MMIVRNTLTLDSVIYRSSQNYLCSSWRRPGVSVLWRPAVAACTLKSLDSSNEGPSHLAQK
jgi:hypothetical protein